MNDKSVSNLSEQALKNRAEATLKKVSELFAAGDMEAGLKMLKEHKDVVLSYQEAG